MAVTHHARKFGKSKYGFSKFYKGIFDLLTILFYAKYMKNPMHFFGMLGIVFACIGGGILGYFGVEWIVTRHMHMRPLVLLAIGADHHGDSIHFIGLIGEMLTNFTTTTPIHPRYAGCLIQTIMKILCICPIGIGNYLLCYPAFALLKKSMPSASLHLLALREGVAQLAHGDFLWEGITSFDPTKSANHPSRMIAIIAGLRSKNSTRASFFSFKHLAVPPVPRLAGINDGTAFVTMFRRGRNCRGFATGN